MLLTQLGAYAPKLRRPGVPRRGSRRLPGQPQRFRPQDHSRSRLTVPDPKRLRTWPHGTVNSLSALPTRDLGNAAQHGGKSRGRSRPPRAATALSPTTGEITTIASGRRSILGDWTTLLAPP